MEFKKNLLAFMAERPYMSLSTINDDGKPNSAIVGFAATDSFELIFGTLKTTRKAGNISQKNGNVSVIIGWDMRGTIQYEGAARLLKPDELDEYTAIYYAKNPEIKKYRNSPDERHFVIEPRWLKYTDTTTNPWTVTELEF